MCLKLHFLVTWLDDVKRCSDKSQTPQCFARRCHEDITVVMMDRDWMRGMGGMCEEPEHQDVRQGFARPISQQLLTSAPSPLDSSLTGHAFISGWRMSFRYEGRGFRFERGKGAQDTWCRWGDMQEEIWLTSHWCIWPLTSAQSHWNTGTDNLSLTFQYLAESVSILSVFMKHSEHKQLQIFDTLPSFCHLHLSSLTDGRNVAGISARCFDMLGLQMLALPWKGPLSILIVVRAPCGGISGGDAVQLVCFNEALWAYVWLYALCTDALFPSRPLNVFVWDDVMKMFDLWPLT